MVVPLGALVKRAWAKTPERLKQLRESQFHEAESTMEREQENRKRKGK